MAYNRASEKDNAPEMIERVVYLNRVSKTVKGGRVMKFSALVVVGDGKGHRGLWPGQGRRGFRGDPEGHCQREEEHGEGRSRGDHHSPTKSSASLAPVRSC